MRWFKKKTLGESPEDQRAAATNGENIDEQETGSWTNSKTLYDDRYMRLAASARNWRRAFGWVLFYSFCRMGLDYHVYSLPKLEPVPIAVDKLGKSAVIRDSKPDAALAAKQEYSEVGDFIENCRTVIVDKMGLRRLQARCYSRLPDESAARRWYVDHIQGEQDPFKIAESYSIEATVTNRLKLSDGNWEVEWLEQKIDLKGGRLGLPVKFKGHLSIEFLKGTNSMDQLMQNPNGFYVQRLTWAQVR